MTSPLLPQPSLEPLERDRATLRPMPRGTLVGLLSLLSVASLAGCESFGSGDRTPSEAVPPPIVGTAVDTTIALEPIAGRTFVVQGQTARIPVKLRRGNGATGPVTIAVNGLRAGLAPRTLVLPSGVTEAELVLDATADAQQGELDANIAATLEPTGDVETGVQTSTTALPLFVRGAPGAVDTTFGAGGFATNVFASEAWLVDLVVLPDDRILAVSELRSDVARAAARRLAADGKVDETYGDGGTAKLGFNYPTAAVAEPDGELTIVGGANASCVVGRLDRQGKPDTTFGDFSFGAGTFGISTGASGVANAPYGVAIRPDGDLAVAFAWQHGVSLIGVARVSRAGTLVGSFGTDGFAGATLGTNTAGAGFTVRSTGQIVAAGSFDAGVGVVQWTGDSGARDSSFGATNGAASFPRPSTGASPAGVVVLADDSVVAPYLDSASGQLVLVRFGRDGKTLEPSFGTSGIAGPFAASGELTDIVRQNDGKLLVMLSHTGGQEILRFMPTGAPDASFGSQGRVVTKIGTDSLGKAIALQKDGRILVGGRATNDGVTFDSTVTRYWP